MSASGLLAVGISLLVGGILLTGGALAPPRDPREDQLGRSLQDMAKQVAPAMVVVGIGLIVAAGLVAWT